LPMCALLLGRDQEEFQTAFEEQQRQRMVRLLYDGEDPMVAAQQAGPLPSPDDSYPHTHLPEALVTALVEELSGGAPLFVIESGSFVGGSAIRIANALRANHGGLVLCVDPFCGDSAMWADKAMRAWLRIRGGRPRLFEQFVANIAAAGCEDLVLPMCATTCAALGALRRLQAGHDAPPRPGLIYLDSAHEEGETLVEIRAAYELLRPGGVLLGDDWSWEAVRNDVLRFASSQRLTPPALPGLPTALFVPVAGAEGVAVSDGGEGDAAQWLIQKPEDSSSEWLSASRQIVSLAAKSARDARGLGASEELLGSLALAVGRFHAADQT